VKVFLILNGAYLNNTLVEGIGLLKFFEQVLSSSTNDTTSALWSVSNSA